LLVTDDFPGFIVPAQNRAIAAAVNVAAHAIDGNGLIPLALLGKSCSAAAHLRPRIHKLFADCWGHRAVAEPVIPSGRVEPPFEVWNAPDDLAMFVRSLPADQSVKPVPQTPGGSTPALQLLNTFVSKKLTRYAGERSQPGDPTTRAASGLSPYLHFGHLSMQQVCEVVLGDDWTPKEINPKTRNKDDFYCRDANVNAFLDEAITWRDLGYHWHHCRNAEVGMRNAESKTQSWDEGKKPSFNFDTMDFSPRSRRTLETVLPPWALASLRKHASDPREYVYSLEEWEAGATHDPLWNAAQTELVHTGTIHNYLRMLWGKKVLEWSATPEEGYDTLEYLNNKYALDGRDPNSYTGILWCFGLFDRPWPERDVFGVIRYMSSANTAKKFPLKGYLDYVRTLARGTRTLFDDEK
jgi:deoxyribodipyrimidine photo-lyase